MHLDRLRGADVEGARAAEGMRDGLYEGSNEQAALELRVDRAGAAAISADIYRLSGGRRDWVASVRTAPGGQVGSGDHPWTVIGEDDLGGTASGRLSVSSLQGTIDGVSAVLVLDSRLNGLPRHSGSSSRRNGWARRGARSGSSSSSRRESTGL